MEDQLLGIKVILGVIILLCVVMGLFYVMTYHAMRLALQAGTYRNPLERQEVKRVSFYFVLFFLGILGSSVVGVVLVGGSLGWIFGGWFE